MGDGLRLPPVRYVTPRPILHPTEIDDFLAVIPTVDQHLDDLPADLLCQAVPLHTEEAHEAAKLRETRQPRLDGHEHVALLHLPDDPLHSLLDDSLFRVTFGDRDSRGYLTTLNRA